MTGREPIEAARRLEELLDEAIGAPSPTRGASKMPEIGATRLAGRLSSVLSDLRRQAAAIEQDISAAAAELGTELKAGKQVAAAIRAETASVRQSFADLLGNQPPADQTEQPDPKEGA